MRYCVSCLQGERCERFLLLLETVLCCGSSPNSSNVIISSAVWADRARMSRNVLSAWPPRKPLFQGNFSQERWRFICSVAKERGGGPSVIICLKQHPRSGVWPYGGRRKCHGGASPEKCSQKLLILCSATTGMQMVNKLTADTLLE